MTDYPGSGETIADDADRILQARRMFERPVQLIAVANDELNKPLALLRDAFGEDTRGFRQVSGEIKQIQEELKEIATNIGTVRFRLDQTAAAIKRAGS
jgi:hypothetical protein